MASAVVPDRGIYAEEPRMPRGLAPDAIEGSPSPPTWFYDCTIDSTLLQLRQTGDRLVVTLTGASFD